MAASTISRMHVDTKTRQTLSGSIYFVVVGSEVGFVVELKLVESEPEFSCFILHVLVVTLGQSGVKQ